MRILKWLTLGLVIACAITGAWIGWSKFSQNYSFYWIKTGSMDPTIKPESLIVVRKHSFEPGQVITFVVEGQTVTHRLRGYTYLGTTVTRGDNNPSDDPWHVSKTAIAGHAVWAIYFGQLLSWLGIVLGLAIMALVVCLFWPSKKPEPLQTPVA